jgi:hypothetical protein
MRPAGAGRGVWRCAEKRRGRQAPGGARSFNLSPAIGPPQAAPLSVDPGRLSGLRFIFLCSTGRSDITAVGHADLCHVVIVFAPCIIAAAAAMSLACLPRLAFCGTTPDATQETSTPGTSVQLGTANACSLIESLGLFKSSGLLRAQSAVSHPG